MKRLAMQATKGAFICTAVFLLLTTLEGPRAVAADAVTNATIAERISAAKTAADHEAIAAYYREEAAAMGADVKRHEAMLAKYRELSSETTRIMSGHCKTLISSYRQAQQAFDDLAAEHTKLAKAAGAGH